jgi:hypothetical protein
MEVGFLSMLRRQSLQETSVKMSALNGREDNEDILMKQLATVGEEAIVISTILVIKIDPTSMPMIAEWLVMILLHDEVLFDAFRTPIKPVKFLFLYMFMILSVNHHHSTMMRRQELVAAATINESSQNRPVAGQHSRMMPAFGMLQTANERIPNPRKSPMFLISHLHLKVINRQILSTGVSIQHALSGMREKTDIHTSMHKLGAQFTLRVSSEMTLNHIG